MSYDPEDVGGDPACWLHLFEDELDGGTAEPAEPAEPEDEAAVPEHDTRPPG